MSTVNRIVLIGHLGEKPTLKYTSSGKSVAILNMATNHNYRAQEGDEEMVTKTVWHRIAVWGRLGELVSKYLDKGDKIFVEGALDNRQYETNKGEKRYISEVKAYFIETMKSLHALQQKDVLAVNPTATT